MSFAAVVAQVTFLAIWYGLFRTMGPDTKTAKDYPVTRAILAAVSTVPIGGMAVLVAFALAGGELA